MTFILPKISFCSENKFRFMVKKLTMSFFKIVYYTTISKTWGQFWAPPESLTLCLIGKLVFSILSSCLSKDKSRKPNIEGSSCCKLGL